MEFCKHNWATISETICPQMLIFAYPVDSAIYLWNNCSLQKQSSFLAPLHLGRFARRDFCASPTEIPYWWRKFMFA